MEAIPCWRPRLPSQHERSGAVPSSSFPRRWAFVEQAGMNMLYWNYQLKSTFYRILWRRIDSHHHVYFLLPTRKYNRTLWVCDGQSLQVKTDWLGMNFHCNEFYFLKLKCLFTFKDLFGFRYIIGTLDLMVAENYILVYLCGMAPRNKMPGIKWLRQCYMSIDRRWAILWFIINLKML